MKLFVVFVCITTFFTSVTSTNNEINEGCSDKNPCTYDYIGKDGTCSHEKFACDDDWECTHEKSDTEMNIECEAFIMRNEFRKFVAESQFVDEKMRAMVTKIETRGIIMVIVFFSTSLINVLIVCFLDIIPAVRCLYNKDINKRNDKKTH